jgi:hypothetical protein
MKNKSLCQKLITIDTIFEAKLNQLKKVKSSFFEVCKSYLHLDDNFKMIQGQAHRHY